MERLILDTSVLIAIERGRLDTAEVIDSKDDIAISAVTAAELLMGVELASKGHQRQRLRAVEATLEQLAIEPYDLECARAHAKLLTYTRQAGAARGAYDLLIAATALARSRTVVTADLRGFQDLPGLKARLVG